MRFGSFQVESTSELVGLDNPKLIERISPRTAVWGFFMSYFCGMNWIGDRISFVEDKQKITFVIYPEKKPFATGLIGAWFAMWLSIGGIMIWAMLTFEMSNQEQIITFVFMAFWVYYAQRVGRSFLWLMYGKEMLKINEAAFTVKRAIKKFGKAHAYFHENITKMSMTSPKDTSFQAAWEKSPWVVGGERITFEYLGKTVRFGRKLPEKEAKLLFNMITKRIEARARAAKKNSNN